MFFPYSTDAPVYHWPISTGALIVANVAMFGAVESGAIVDPSDLVLVWGNGLHPHQWLTSNFIHGNLMHLIGNMMFLWVFGLVVEGKVGWLRFLLIYLGIGVFECAVEQALLLGAEVNASYGASAIDFGLLAMAMVWAPENEAQVVYWIYRPGTTSVRHSTLAFLYFLIEGAQAALGAAAGAGMTSAALHLMGMVPGAAVAIVMLKRNMVDCEGWDIFSRKSLKRRPAADRQVKAHERASSPSTAAVLTASEKRQSALRLMRDHLGAGDVDAALFIYRETVAESGSWPMPGPDLLSIVQALQKARRWQELLPFLEEALERLPEKRDSLLLLSGKVFIEATGNPERGLACLRQIRIEKLTAAQSEVREKLIEKASG